MADLWLPGAYRDPGVNANYNAGRNQLIRTVAHYTVGNDSRNTGRTGYCHVLVHKSADRENGATCYAPIDAVTWHAANQGNPYGPGIEWERMTTGGQNDEGLSNADPLTDNQIEWGNRIVAFLLEWGIEARLYDGPRFGDQVMPGGNFNGWVNHHDIDDQRTDGLLRAEWDVICGGDVEPPEPDIDWAYLRRLQQQQEDDENMAKFAQALLTDGRLITAIRGQDSSVNVRITSERGDNDPEWGWTGIPGACRFTPELVATADGGARLRIVGGDWEAYEAILEPGAGRFGAFTKMGGLVAGMSNYE